MARDLLTEAARRKLAAELGQGPQGTDVAMSEDEAAGFTVLVVCDGGTHLVRRGTVCQECHSGCSMPGDPECKGRE